MRFGECNLQEWVTASSDLPVAWQKRKKVVWAPTRRIWSLRNGGIKVTVAKSALDQTSGWGLMDGGRESLSVQEKEEEPVGGKVMGDEAVAEEDRTGKRRRKGH